jgi:hypothetical protein
MLGAADVNDFALGTLTCVMKNMRPQSPPLSAATASRAARRPVHCQPRLLPPPPIGRRCSVTPRSAASPAGSRPGRATARSGPPKSWQGTVNNALERSPLEPLPMSDDLPPPNTRRWVVRRKAAVVTAVRTGRITLEEALRRYQLTEEEYRSWERAFEQHGLAGLRSTRRHQYRSPRTPSSSPASSTRCVAPSRCSAKWPSETPMFRPMAASNSVWGSISATS